MLPKNISYLEPATPFFNRVTTLQKNFDRTLERKRCPQHTDQNIGIA